MEIEQALLYSVMIYKMILGVLKKSFAVKEH
jgi:hypothetical protein